MYHDSNHGSPFMNVRSVPQAVMRSPSQSFSEIAHEHAQGRYLPSREMTDDTIEEAFAAFILYANPFYPLDSDTTELKRVFRNMPKSDGKDFSTFSLWQLISKLDNKEIKTWIQLALELGVVPPVVENGQSVQKVQQYTVRLKRWMRALHVDAFFEYLLGKDHSYYRDLPAFEDPHPVEGRDGVLAEEDLALRALDPTFKPKRGRKRHESPEPESAHPKRLMLLTSFSDSVQTPTQETPRSAFPAQANRARIQSNKADQDPWTAVSAVTPYVFGRQMLAPQSAISPRPRPLRWPSEQTPSTPHPFPAIERSSSAIGGSESAVTPTASRKRRHGPAVSSAWSSMSTSSGKTRGRPSGQREVADGQFSTFPVKPAIDHSPLIHTVTPTIEIGESTLNGPTSWETDVTASQNRERLKLQVPQYQGAAVRLMTPPSTSFSRKDTPAAPLMQASQPSIESATKGDALPTVQYETLKRTLAADLLRAEVVGRSSRLTSNETKSLSSSVLSRVGLSSTTTDLSDLTAASRWLALDSPGPRAQVTSVLRPHHGTKKVAVTYFTTDDEGYQIPIEVENASAHLPGITQVVYDITWNSSLGGLSADFSIRGIELSPETTGEPHDQSAGLVPSSVDGTDEESDWQAMYHALTVKMASMEQALERAKERVLDTVLSL